MNDPRGFQALVTNAGLKDGGDDFTVLVSEGPASSAAVFTQSRFAGPSIVLSRESARAGTARGVVVISKNANVATGAEGLANAREVRAAAARAIGAPEGDMLIASTGVIGRQYPMPAIRERLATLAAPFPPADFDRVASAIMTTDTHPKIARARCGAASIVGVAKGVGMLEPNMATMLAFFCTDAEVAPADLDRVFRNVVARTFNAVSVDTDTSTSDTAAIFANGVAGLVDLGEFERALHQCALTLVKMIARDGEGASKLIEVNVTGARDDDQAKRVAKAIVNSPLVKTAVHGADPNWGRVAMAIGKCEDETDIDQDRVRIGFGGLEVYPAPRHAGDARQARRPPARYRRLDRGGPRYRRWRVHRVRLRPDRGVHPDQRGLHHLSRRAQGGRFDATQQPLGVGGRYLVRVDTDRHRHAVRDVLDLEFQRPERRIVLRREPPERRLGKPPGLMSPGAARAPAVVEVAIDVDRAPRSSSIRSRSSKRSPGWKYPYLYADITDRCTRSSASSNVEPGDVQDAQAALGSGTDDTPASPGRNRLLTTGRTTTGLTP